MSRSCASETRSSLEWLTSGVDYSRVGLTVVHDERPDCGPFAGLAAILKSTPFDKTLALAVDMPVMTPAMLKKIVTLC